MPDSHEAGYDSKPSLMHDWNCSPGDDADPMLLPRVGAIARTIRTNINQDSTSSTELSIGVRLTISNFVSVNKNEVETDECQNMK
jgi:hypothetical protein